MNVLTFIKTQVYYFVNAFFCSPPPPMKWTFPEINVTTSFDRFYLSLSGFENVPL